MTRFFWAFHQGKCVHCPIEVVNLMARGINHSVAQLASRAHLNCHCLYLLLEFLDGVLERVDSELQFLDGSLEKADLEFLLLDGFMERMDF